VHAPSQFELAARLVVAMVLGGVLGFERELRDRPAGLRTHVTVAIGSALFVIAGAYGLEQFVSPRNTNNLSVAPDRVASTVVTGIGFLGGGAILKHGASVRGLTTAGSLWVTSAIGMAVGFGIYVVALAATAVTIVTLVGLRWPEQYIQRKLAVDRDTVVVRLRGGGDPAPVIAAIGQLEGVRVHSLMVRDDGEGVTVESSIGGPRGQDMAGTVAPLAALPGVESVEVV
jgi:putative Mg2+ transporter-C (MgtC) family protein